jgi:hypothetical protein
MFQGVYFCTVLYECNFYVIYVPVRNKEQYKRHFLEHREHRNYNYKEQYKNKLPGT